MRKADRDKVKRYEASFFHEKGWAVWDNHEGKHVETFGEIVETPTGPVGAGPVAKRRARELNRRQTDRQLRAKLKAAQHLRTAQLFH